MAVTEKFTFDLDFDEERVRLAKELHAKEMDKKRAQEEAEIEASKHRYTPEEIEEIKTQARQEGEQKALQYLKEQNEQKALDRLKSILQQFEKLDGHEQEREKLAHRVGIETTLKLIKKLSPSIMQGREVDDIKAVVMQAFEENPNEQRLVIRVHDSVLDQIIKDIDPMAKKIGFSGKSIIVADQNLQPQDCRVEWADGGMEKVTATVWQNLEQAVQQILNGMPKIKKKDISKGENNLEDDKSDTQVSDEENPQDENKKTNQNLNKQEEVTQ